MIPYCRPKRSDLYTLCYSNLLENHTLHSDTYPYIAQIWQYTPPSRDQKPKLWLGYRVFLVVSICTLFLFFPETLFSILLEPVRNFTFNLLLYILVSNDY